MFAQKIINSFLLLQGSNYSIRMHGGLKIVLHKVGDLNKIKMFEWIFQCNDSDWRANSCNSRTKKFSARDENNWIKKMLVFYRYFHHL